MEPFSCSIIVASCERAAELARCLQSIAAQTMAPLEVIVADDASIDPAVRAAAAAFPTLVWLGSDRRRGFAANANRALALAGGEWRLLLNDDIALETGFLQAAAARLHRAPPEVGLAAPKILLADRPHLLDNAGHGLYLDGQNRGRGRLEMDCGQYDAAQPPIFPSGAACFLRRPMLDDIGLFDESFFMYGEDADLGLRARLAGWQCLYLPAARCYHGHGASRGGYREETVLLIERNRLLLLIKNMPGWALALAPLFTLLRYACSALAALLGRGAVGEFTRRRSWGALGRTAWRAHAQAAALAKEALAARRRQRPLRRLNRRQTWQLLRRHFLSPWEIAFRR